MRRSAFSGRWTVPAEERFAAQYEPSDRDACWNWQGGTDRYGRGKLRVNGKTWTASRFALFQAKGPPPRDDVPMVARHHCDNPVCVNPHHLDWGTHQDNSRDAVKRKRFPAIRKTHCVRGHALEGGNLCNVKQSGRRVCRLCKQVNAERRRRERGVPRGQAGENSVSYKLSDAAVAEIRAIEGGTHEKIAQAYGVSRSLVSQIRRGVHR